MAAHAYRLAGYKAKGDAAYVSACQILGNRKVKERLEELEKEAIDAAELTKDKIMGQFLDVLSKAKGANNWNVASATLERIAKFAGLWTDKHEDVTQKDPTKMLEELETGLIEAFGKEHAEMLMAQYRQKLGQPQDTDERAH